MNLLSAQNIHTISIGELLNNQAHALEVAIQYIHNQVNQSLHLFLSENTVSQIKKNQEDNPLVQIFIKLDYAAEKKIHLIIWDEIQSFNSKFKGVLSETQIKGLHVYFKQLITPHNHHISNLWHYRFNPYSMNQTVFSILLPCMAARLWNELAGQDFIHPDEFERVLRVRFKDDINNLYSLTLCTTQEDKNRLNFIIEESLTKLIEGHKNNGEAFSNNNCFYFRPPAILSAHIPASFKSELIQEAVNQLISDEGKVDGLVGFSDFINLHEDVILENNFPQMEFKQWCEENVYEVLRFFINKKAANIDSKELGFDGRYLSVDTLPSGSVLVLANIIVSAFLVNSYCTLPETKDKPMEVLVFSRYIDFLEDSEEVWVAIALNLIYTVTRYRKNTFSDDEISLLAFNYLMAINGYLELSQSEQSIRGFIAESIKLYKAYKVSSLQEQMDKSINQKFNSGINLKDFHDFSQKSIS